MADVEKSVLIPHTAAQMFDLVDKVEDYPKFLPWCNATEVQERNNEHTVAALHVGLYGLKSSFSTENLKQYPLHMDIRLREGPFKHLNGSWQFIPLGDSACKVAFHLHYEFSSKLLEQVLGPVFGHITNTIVESFVKRAQQVYG